MNQRGGGGDIRGLRSGCERSIEFYSIGTPHQLQMFLQRFRNVHAFRGRSLFSSATSQVREFKVVLDGQTLYIEKPLAEALGWSPGTSTEGVSLRLSGWEPKFFAITPTGTDFGMLLSSIPGIISNTLACQTFWPEQQ